MGNQTKKLENLFLHLNVGKSGIYVIISVVLNSNMSQLAIKKEYELQEETKETKRFVQDMFQVDYVNSSKIYYELPQNSPEVKVNNYLCYQQGQVLYKITEIIYEDKLIRIEDKFEVSLDPSHLNSSVSVIQNKNEKKNQNCSRNIQKIRIFNKHTKKPPQGQKKDKKNIVKNIVKLFVCWLQKKELQKSAFHSQIFRELKQFLKTQNFNNRLIQKIVRSKQVSKAFLQFIEDSAVEQIKYSRIQDKQSHYQAVQIYKNLLVGNSKNSGSDVPSCSQGSQEEQDSQNSQFKLSQGKNLSTHNASYPNKQDDHSRNFVQATVKQIKQEYKYPGVIVSGAVCSFGK